MSSAIPLSPLYTRYNGFTLGAFLAASRFPFARRRYPAFRGRIQEFFAEVGLDLALPKTHPAYVSRADRLFATILTSVGDRSEVLRDFAGLGAMSVLHGVNVPLLSAEQRKALRKRWLPVLKKYGVGRDMYDEWLDGLQREDKPVLMEDVLTPASAMLTCAVAPLEPEPETCFVAMPFRAPFVGYYSTFYRASLERAGLRAIRAWGGLSSEEYYILLLTLISRSGCMLAELTTLNLNVINEVGIAHGAQKVVFLIGDASLSELPSNIAQMPNFTYRPGSGGWIPDAVERCSKFISWMKADFDGGRRKAGGGSPGPL